MELRQLIRNKIKSILFENISSFKEIGDFAYEILKFIAYRDFEKYFKPDMTIYYPYSIQTLNKKFQDSIDYSKYPTIGKFIKERNIEIGFNLDMSERQKKLGTYTTHPTINYVGQIDNEHSIEIHITKDMLTNIIHEYKWWIVTMKSDSFDALSLASKYYYLFHSHLTHELQHAYDDFRTDSKIFKSKQFDSYKNDYIRNNILPNKEEPTFIQASTDKHTRYLKLPHEIWARFAEAVRKINFSSYNLDKDGNKIWFMKPIEDVLNKFQSEFNGWNQMTPEIKKRLINKLSSSYYEEADRLKKIRLNEGVFNFHPCVEKLKSFIQQIKNSYKANLYIYPIQRNDSEIYSIVLGKIKIPKSKRGEGLGSKIMNELINFANHENVKIFLTPSDIYGTEKEKLINFYKKFGFNFNSGNNKDDVSDLEMIYKPKTSLNEEIKISNDFINQKTEVENFRHQLSVEFNVALELYYTHPDSGPALKLSLIRVPEAMQRTGIGTQVMRRIIDYADENGLRIFLTPDTSWGSSKSGLFRFYKSFGFVFQNRRNRDFTFNDTMVRMPKSNLDEEVEAYHGTPHKFNKFSLEKMGTGEGAQVYGWGLYFSEIKDVAQHYAQTISADKKMPMYIYHVKLHKGKNDYKWLMWRNPVDKNILSIVAHQLRKENIYPVIDKGIGTKGRFDGLPLLNILNGKKMHYTDGTKGQNLYSELANYLKSQEAASKLLLRAGIDGIKYWAGGSKGQGTFDKTGYNYVIFDADAITIEKVENY